MFITTFLFAVAKVGRKVVCSKNARRCKSVTFALVILIIRCFTKVSLA